MPFCIILPQGPTSQNRSDPLPKVRLIQDVPPLFADLGHQEPLAVAEVGKEDLQKVFFRLQLPQRDVSERSTY